MGLVLVMSANEKEIIPRLRANETPELQYVSQPYRSKEDGIPGFSLWPNGVRARKADTDEYWYCWFEGNYLHCWGVNVSPKNPIPELLKRLDVRIVNCF